MVIILKYVNDTASQMFLAGKGTSALIDNRGNSYDALDPMLLIKDSPLPFSVLCFAPQCKLEMLNPGARSYYVQVFERPRAGIKQLYLHDLSAGGNYKALLQFKQ